MPTYKPHPGALAFAAAKAAILARCEPVKPL